MTMNSISSRSRAEELDDATIVGLTSDGVSLRGRVTGKGPLMIGVHGGLGIDAGYLWGAFDSLADSHQIVCFDQRGHGRSGGRETLDRSSRETLVEDIDCVRRHAGAGRVILFGHSYGGFLALEYAARFPERVAGLALCSTSASLDHVAAAVDRVASSARPDEFSALETLLTDPPASDEQFGALWRAVTPLYFADHDPRRGDVFSATRFSSAGYAAGARFLSSYDMRPRLAEIEAPVSLFHGANDWIMNASTAGDKLARGIPHATRFTFARSGHYPFIEEPTSWKANFTDWAQRLKY